MCKHFTSENVLGAAMFAGIVAIGFSDTVAGFCLRAALVLPAAWAGLVDIETAATFAVR